MKKTSRPKNTGPVKKRSGKETANGPKTAAAKRQKKPAAAFAATESAPVARKTASKSSRALAVRPVVSDKALQVGRTVGTILGKAIGNVERAVSRIINQPKSPAKK